VRGATFRERGGARCSRAGVAARQCHLSLVGEVGQHPREQGQRVGGLGAGSVDARAEGLAPGNGGPSGARPNGRDSIHQSGFRVRRGRMGASASIANGPWTIRPAAWGGPHTRLPFSTSVQLLGRDGAHRPAPSQTPCGDLRGASGRPVAWSGSLVADCETGRPLRGDARLPRRTGTPNTEGTGFTESLPDFGRCDPSSL
jgi:hypothetical protein